MNCVYNFIFSCLFSAIKSLDLLNEQIVQFIFSPKATEIDFDNDLSAKDKEALQASMALMRQLLKVRFVSLLAVLCKNAVGLSGDTLI